MTVYEVRTNKVGADTIPGILYPTDKQFKNTEDMRRDMRNHPENWTPGTYRCIEDTAAVKVERVTQLKLTDVTGGNTPE